MKYEPCRKCKGDKYIYEGDTARPCECYKRYKRRKRLELGLVKAGISPDVLDYNLGRYQGEKSLAELEKVRKYIDNFEEKFSAVSLYLYGTNSTQKTTVAKYIGKALIKRGKSVGFFLMGDFVEMLSKRETDENGYEEEKRRIRDLDVVILDDSFDPKKVTVYKSGYQLSFLDTFLRNRLEQQGKAIIFTSNIPYEEISDKFSTSIAKMIERNSVLLPFKDVYDGKAFDLDTLFD